MQIEVCNTFKIKTFLAFEVFNYMFWDYICVLVNTIVRDKYMAEELSLGVYVKVRQHSDYYNPWMGRFSAQVFDNARNVIFVKLCSTAFNIRKYQNYEKNWFIYSRNTFYLGF